MNINASLGDDIERMRRAAQSDVQNLRARKCQLDDDSIDLILTGARSHYAWSDKPVSEDQIQQIYDMVKMGSTSMNSCPARFVFVRTIEGKERLAKSLKPANVAKMMNAPVTAIIAYDPQFWKELPRLFPHEDRRGQFFRQAGIFRRNCISQFYPARRVSDDRCARHWS